MEYKGYAVFYIQNITDIDDKIIKQARIEGITEKEVAEKYIEKNLDEDEINAYYEKEIFGEQTVRHILIMPETNDKMTEDEITEAEANALKEATHLQCHTLQQH